MSLNIIKHTYKITKISETATWSQGIFDLVYWSVGFWKIDLSQFSGNCLA